MKIKEHKLYYGDGKQVEYERSPNRSGIIKPKFLVIHYSAGKSAQRTVKTLCSPKRKASAHLVIGKDGKIYQLGPFDRKMWHAGKSKWKNLKSLNNYSIGIELDNPGRLSQKNNGTFVTWFGEEIDSSNVIMAKHKNEKKICPWHIYSSAQLEVLEDVAELLFDEYNLEDVLGHDDIAKGRKSDPGPAFPMKNFRSLLLGRKEAADEEEEEVDGANGYNKTEEYVR